MNDTALAAHQRVLETDVAIAHSASSNHAEQVVHTYQVLSNAEEPVWAPLHPTPNAVIAGSAGDDDENPTGRWVSTVGEPEIDDLLRFSGILQQSHRLTRHSTFHVLQEWEGYVVQLDVNELVARLVDLTAGSSVEEEEAVIPLAEVDDYDAQRIRLGSVFRWVIGYEHSPTGKKRVSQIVFRDRPAITKTDVNAGVKWAEEVIRSLDL